MVVVEVRWSYHAVVAVAVAAAAIRIHVVIVGKTLSQSLVIHLGSGL